MDPIIGGALIGGAANLIGAGLGAWNSSKDRAAQERLAKEKAQRVKSAVKKANASYGDILKQLETYRSGQTTLADPSMIQDYKQAISGYNPEDYTYDFDKFSFDKSVDDYVSPYMDKIIQATSDNVQSTAAGAGLGRSGGTAYDIAQVVAEKNNELYRTAMEDYNRDRQFAYQEYSDYINNMQNKFSNLANLTSNKINMLGGAIQHDEQQTSDYMGDLLGIMQDKAQLGVNASLYT